MLISKCFVIFIMNMLLRYMEMDKNLYEKCSREWIEKSRTKELERSVAKDRWQKMEAAASANGVSLSASSQG